MRILILINITIYLTSCSSSAILEGYYTGKMELNGKTIDVQLNFDNENSMFSCPDLAIVDLSLSNLEQEMDSVTFSINPGNAILFKCAIRDSKIIGSGHADGAPEEFLMNLELSKNHLGPPEKPYNIEEIKIETENVVLASKVFKPNTGEPHPAIILLHGSSTNLMEHYTFYADFFAKQGFEVLIFDKRGNGASTGDYTVATNEDLVDDAIECLNVMSKRNTVDTNKIGLWGFSQGASLLPYIASKSSIVSFLIAKSPEIYKISDASAYQDSIRVLNMGYSPDEGHVVAENHRQTEQLMQNGCSVDELMDFMNNNAQKSNYMNYTGLQEDISISDEEFKSYYWMGRTFNAYPYWQDIKLKALILFGKDDIYIDAIKNEEGILTIGSENLNVKVFPDADHSLRKTINTKKYPDLDFPRIVSGYLEFLEQWIEDEI